MKNKLFLLGSIVIFLFPFFCSASTLSCEKVANFLSKDENQKIRNEVLIWNDDNTNEIKIYTNYGTNSVIEITVEYISAYSYWTVEEKFILPIGTSDSSVYAKDPILKITKVSGTPTSDNEYEYIFWTY